MYSPFLSIRYQPLQYPPVERTRRFTREHLAHIEPLPLLQRKSHSLTTTIRTAAQTRRLLGYSNHPSWQQLGGVRMVGVRVPETLNKVGSLQPPLPETSHQAT